ncbi:MAG: HAMP domain-containing sensor histidine kinase [Gemmatimonadota bacterium]|jgi:signal transduction histidine kinase
MVFLLFLTLGLAGVLAYQAWDAHRAHERVAKSALEDHALSAAWELTSAIRRELYGRLLSPGLEASYKTLAAYPEAPLPSFVNFEKALESFWWSFESVKFDFLFRYNFTKGKLEFRGGGEPVEEAKGWLTAYLKERITSGVETKTELPAGVWIYGAPNEEKILVYGVHIDPDSGGLIAFGFQTVDLSPVKATVENVAKGIPLIAPALTGRYDPSDLLSFSVTAPSGRTVFSSFPQYPSEIQASDTVGTALGALTGTVNINPAAIELLVIGGLPKSRLPAILVLLGLTSAMVLVSFFQLRREQELSLLRTDFVSSVSHQLRTPLAQIRMFGETLLLGRVRSEEEEQRSLEIIVKEAQRLTHQVDNVLHFSRAQRGEIALSLQEAHLAPLVSEVLESFCPLAEAQDCRVESSLDETLKAWVDPGAFRQILLNLLENAVKYGPSNQIVDVRLRKGPGGIVQLLVEDEGEGIPADQRAEVFSPYSRLERDRDSGVAGSGIGLAVVKELAQRQGASVRVEDSVSGGARFIVAFPPVTDRPRNV